MLPSFTFECLKSSLLFWNIFWNIFWKFFFSWFHLFENDDKRNYKHLIRNCDISRGNDGIFFFSTTWKWGKKNKFLFAHFCIFKALYSEKECLNVSSKKRNSKNVRKKFDAFIARYKMSPKIGCWWSALQIISHGMDHWYGYILSKIFCLFMYSSLILEFFHSGLIHFCIDFKCSNQSIELMI